jgi:ankyrin repeat protein
MRCSKIMVLSLGTWVLCTSSLHGQDVGYPPRIPALFRAVLSGDALKLKELLKQGADPNEKTQWGWAPLHQAMFMRPEICQILLKAGADVNIRIGEFGPVPSNQWTPVFYATSLGRTDLIIELLKHGANVNILDRQGHQPLFYAVLNRKKDIADLLRKAGAQPLLETPLTAPMATPAYYPHGPLGPAVPIPKLYQAIMMHDRRRVEDLLKGGADPNERVPTGLAPLHEAMESDLLICQLLLQYGADPNIRVAKNEQGGTNDWTPLFYAAYDGRDDLIAELLNHGAKANIVDAVGRSPLWYARDQKKEAATKLLRAAGVAE